MALGYGTPVGAAAKSEESGRIDATVRAIPRNLWDFCIEEGEEDFIEKNYIPAIVSYLSKKSKKSPVQSCRKKFR